MFEKITQPKLIACLKSESQKMKIYIPRGSHRTETQQAEWIRSTLEISDNFHSSNTPAFNDVNIDLDLIKDLKKTSNTLEYITPMWQEHVDRLMEVIENNPEKCLRDPLLQYAFNLSACGIYARQQIPYLEERYNKSELARLLKEGSFPGQLITDPNYESSETRINHLTHLTAFSSVNELELENFKICLEFGGGYGSMAHLIRQINPSYTHVIIDIPEMIVFQAYTLGRLFGPQTLNFVTPSNSSVQENLINFVSINHAQELGNFIATPNLFIATWSLSEANAVTNDLIQKQLAFYQAEHILFGYRRYKTPNPAQPNSKAITVPSNYSETFHGPCFYAIENEQYYQFLRRNS
ncbi:MAG: hypothetical protein RIC29_03255 [Rhodospirillaceae bacterium]